MLLRSDIEAIDRPTVLSLLYSTISAQQMNLLPEALSKTMPFSPKADMTYEKGWVLWFQRVKDRFVLPTFQSEYSDLLQGED